MKTSKKSKFLLGCITILFVGSLIRIPPMDSMTVALFTNRTCDTLFVGASHYDTVDSVHCLLEPAYLSVDSSLYPSKVTLWKDIDVQRNIVYPDSSLRISHINLFGDADTCYLFLIKWNDAKNHSWNEIRKRKLYRKWVVTKDKEGQFDGNIKCN